MKSLEMKVLKIIFRTSSLR